MKPWYLLVDESTNGVLIGVQDPIIVNQLRRGVLDARLFWTRENFDPESDAHSGYKKRALFALAASERTPIFEEKRRVLKLRVPAFEFWRGVIIDQLRKAETFYAIVDPYLAPEIAASTKEKPTELLREYAATIGLPVEEVYEFSRLSVEENAHRRLMLHALAEKHARAINACTDEAQIAAACDAIRADFIKK